MKFTREIFAGNIIRDVTAKGFVIGNDTLPGPLVLTADEIVRGWTGQAIADLVEEDFELLLDRTPEIVLLGTGATTIFPPRELVFAMARRGENHYLRPNIPDYFKWIVLSLVPGEDTGETVGYSSCRANPYESAPVLARWAMPGNPLVNYYLRLRPKRGG